MKTRKFLSFLLAFALALSLMPASTASAEVDKSIFAGGDGTPENPYKIATAQQLNDFRNSITYSYRYDGEYILLTADIDLNGSSENKSKATYPFKGTFDGGDYKITGLYGDSYDNSGYKGLFSEIEEGGTVKNLSLDGTFKSDTYVGAVTAINSGTIQNCHSSCNIVGNDGDAGGIAGWNYGLIENCSNSGVINGGSSFFVGGVVGYNTSYGKIIGCWNTGEVKEGLNRVGGIAGCNSGTLENSYNTGNISGQRDCIGGVSGDGSLKNCYNTGNIIGKDCVGGVVGSAGETVENCYNTGTVSRTEDSSSGEIGGVSGSIYYRDSLKNCRYLDGCVKIPQAYDTWYTTKLTSDQMKDAANFANWDFDTVWIMGDDAPLFRYQVPLLPAKLTTDKYDLNNDGKMDNVYEIGAANELAWFANKINNYEKNLNAVLTEDIVINSGTWTPIGVNYSDFEGIFDGQNHTISNMKFTTAQNGYGGHLTYNYQGLFGVIRNSAIVRNFTVKGRITLAVAEQEYIGGAVGLAYEGAEISNVTSYVDITDGGTAYGDIKWIGGVVGQIGTDGKTSGYIDWCKYYGTINVDTAAKVGGIVGCAVNDSYVTNSTNYGKIGWNYIGHIAGVVGSATTGTHVVNCANYGEVSANCHDCIGGVVGYANQYVTINNCLNGGNISGQPSSGSDNAGAYIGGILGYINNSNFAGLTNCFNYGTVKNSGGTNTYTGALIGWLRNGAAAVKDNYYLTTSCAKACGGNDGTNNTSVTAIKAASGEIAYKLQGSQTEQAWGQTLTGENYDTYPVLGGAKVYYAKNCTGIYSYSNKEIHSEHNYTNGVCQYCGSSEQLNKNSSGYYEIGSKADYIHFTNLVNANGEKTELNAVLTQDIDLSGYEYVPIGKDGSRFIGTFDGAGRKIENLTMAANNSYMGMFGRTNGASVKNFTVSGNITVVCDTLQNIGGVIGLADSTSVSDVISKVNFKDNGKIEHIYRAGGIAAQARYGSSFKNCEYSGDITLHFGSHTTGIVGVTSDAGKDNPNIIENCVNKANMKFDISRRVAGIVGWNDTYTTVSKCANYGNITIKESDGTNQAAGIVAVNVSAVTVTDCANYGNITDGKFNSSLGGIVGFLDVYKSTDDFGGIKNCFNYGKITNTNENGSTYWGSLIGYIKNDEANQSIISKITDNYYFEETAPTVSGTDGISVTANKSNTWSASSGDLAYILQGSRSETIWGQVLTGENKTDYPVPNGERVFKVTYIASDDYYGCAFANASGIGTLPGIPSADFVKWTCGPEEDSEEFTESTPISSDITVYAQTDPEESPDISIYNSDGLKALRDAVNEGETYEGKYIALKADIDLGCSADDPWIPIGNDHNQFKGTFVGNDYKITGLYIESSSDYQGLFGNVGKGGTVKEVSVEGYVNAEGKYYIGGIVGRNSGTIEYCRNISTVSGTSNRVGGVVGYNNGTIQNCYNTGSVSGKNNTGGVVGFNNENAKVNNCYNTGSVCSPDSSGGVVGYNSGTIQNCYNTGSVSEKLCTGGVVGYNSGTGTIQNCCNTGSVSSTKSSGGVVGYNNSLSTVTNCFYLDTCAAAGTTFNCTQGTALTADEMNDVSKLEGLDFNTVWEMGETAPKLQDTPKKSSRNNPDITISTLEQLKAFRDAVNNGDSCEGKYILLANDIDLEGSEENQWSNIGNETPFKGTFDGNGCNLTGLYINSGCSYEGLFGEVKLGGTVKNLSVSGTVTADSSSGGLVGYNSGKIESCRNTANVTGIDYIGGIVGYNIFGYGRIENCGNEGSVSGEFAVGGVVGYNVYEVKNCYNTGSVTGKERIGGIIGNHWGYLQDCYNTGSVTGEENVGGIAGSSIGDTQQDCYNTGSVTGEKYVGGVAGYGDMTRCYNIGSVSGNENVSGVGLDSYSPNENCYYIEDCAAEGTTLEAESGSTALTAAQMKNAASFTDWDFTSKWVIKADRPLLKSNLEVQKSTINSVGADGARAAAEVFIPDTGTYTVVFADYENGVLNVCEAVTLKVTANNLGTNTVYSTKNITLGTDDKIFLWDNFANLAPLCNAYTVK